MTSYADQHRLSSREMGGWACGEIGITLHIVIISMYGLYLLTEVMHLSPVKAGLILLLPKLWGIVLDPWIGQAMDRFPRSKRPALLVGGLLWAVGFGVAFSLPAWCDRAGLAWAFLAALMIASSGQSIFQIPYTSMTNDLSRLDRDRVQVISLKNIVSRCTVALTAAGFPWFMARGMHEPRSYAWLGLGLGVLIFGNGLLALIATRKVTMQVPCAEPAAGAAMPAGSMRVWRNRPYFLLLLAYGLYCLGQLPFVGLLVYYITLVMHRDPALATSLYPLAALTSALATPVWAWMARRHGKRKMCLLAWLGAAFAWASPLLITPGHVDLLYPLMLVVGIFQAGGDLVPNIMLPDLVDQGRDLPGPQPHQSTLYGVWISQQQTVLALGGVVTSLALSISGYAPGQDRIRASEGITMAMTIPSMLLALMAAWILGRACRIPATAELKAAGSSLQ